MKATLRKPAIIGPSVALMLGVLGFAQGPEDLQSRGKDLFAQILEFIYTIAHQIGSGIVNVIHAIVPAVNVSTDLVDPIGMLAILTIFLAVAEVAKKLVWIVVAVGWLLIIIRIVMVLANG